MNLTMTEISALLGAGSATGAGRSARPGMDMGAACGFVPRRASIDSRKVTPGDLFFCIRGERVDGHDFAVEAERNGAVGMVAERRPEGIRPEMPVILVENAVAALGKLARSAREHTQARVVGVTGSAGKTTVKEMLATVLSVAGATARNFLNLNNQIGLPLSMLEATGEERFWVMECGISQAHDMDELGAILRPDLGLVLNVGAAHLQGLGDVRGVAAHKARLLSHVRMPGGLGLACVDYPELAEEAAKAMPGCIGFSARGGKARFTGAYVGPEGALSGRFTISLDGASMDVVLPWRGEFAAENVVAVSAAAHLLGLDMARIHDGLARCVPAQQRFTCQEAGRILVIDDSYNANPLSMARSLDAAVALAKNGVCARPLVLVLGEMKELGDDAARAHRELGLAMAKAAPHAVFWRGGAMRDVVVGLEEGGYAGPMKSLEGVDMFMAQWRELGFDDAVVLVKGSRSNRMEEFAAGLIEEARDAV
ncbi:MAG: UDP-N-acetylmuramoyl-tripeptide--D-alanyl-D-alanine ligase [Desulfovibrionaceae bacterium]